MRTILLVGLCFALGCDTASVGLRRTANASKLDLETEVVVLTDSAASSVRKFMATDEFADTLEISVEFDDPTTCTGYRYNFALVSDPSPKEFVLVESCGIEIAIDAASVEFLRGTKIDWVPLSEGEEGFYFHNPNSDVPMPDHVRRYYESNATSDGHGVADSGLTNG